MEWKTFKIFRPKNYGAPLHNDHTNNCKKLFRGEEVFIHFTKEVISREDQTRLSQVGEYNFPFTYKLPFNLPYSVDAEFASIQFWIKAKLNVGFVLDLEHTLPFTVIRNDDLNNYPELKKPIEIEAIKKLTCVSKPLIIIVKLEKSGFALGESVRITIEYQNKRNIHVKRTLIELIKYEKLVNQGASTFRASRCVPLKNGYRRSGFGVGRANADTLIKGTKIANERAVGDTKNSNASIEHYLKIPENIHTSNEKLSKMYQISYKLKITAVFDGLFATKQIIKIPITIGNVAIVNPL